MGGWYLRRAISWPLLLGWSAASAACALAALAWHGWSGLGLPLATIAAVAAASFAFDEPALAVTAQAPRGAWARRQRAAVAVLPPLLAWSVIACLPVELRGSLGDWAVVIAGLAGITVGMALTASSLLFSRPGAEIASAVVLAGIAPLFAERLLAIGQAYPQPTLSPGWRTLWVSLALAGAGLATLGLRRCAR